MSEAEVQAPASRRQRISAYAQQSTPAAEPAAEPEGSGNRDPSRAAQTLLSGLGILRPMLFLGAENLRDRPADSSPSTQAYKGDEAPGRDDWRSHGQELTHRHTEGWRQRDSELYKAGEAPGKGEWRSHGQESTH